MSQQAQDGSQFLNQNYLAAQQNGGLTQQPGVQQPEAATVSEDSKEFINMGASTSANAGSPPAMDQNSHQQQNYLSAAASYNNWHQQQQQTMVNQEVAQPNLYAPHQPGFNYPAIGGTPMNQGIIPPLSYPQPQAVPVSAGNHGASGNPVNSMSSSLGSNGSLHTMESVQIKREVSPTAAGSSGDQYQQNAVQQLMGAQQQQQAHLSPPQMQQQTPQQQDFMHQQQPFMQQQMMPMAQPFLHQAQYPQQDFNQQGQQFHANSIMAQSIVPQDGILGRTSPQRYAPLSPFWQHMTPEQLQRYQQEQNTRLSPDNFWQHAHESGSYAFAPTTSTTPKRRNRTKQAGFHLRTPYHKKQLSRKTSYNAKWGVKSLSAFLKKQKMEEDPTKLSRFQLTKVLPLYYQSVRKVDGNLYSYNSLVNIRAMLNSYLRAAHPERIDIVVGKEFRCANEVFERQLRKILHLNKPMTNGPITQKDMEEMIENGVFNTQERGSLLMKVWFDLTRYLGNQITLPQSQWTRDMLKVFFDKSRDSFYVTWITPYADGQEHRMYETKTDGCPVGSLTYYISKLNPINNHVFQKSCLNDGHIWFGPETLEQEELDTMMTTISEMAALPVKYTNKSVTGSAYSTLYRPRVSSQASMEVCEEYTFNDIYRCRTATSNHSRALNNFLAVPPSRL